MIAARPSEANAVSIFPQENDREELARSVALFSQNYRQKVEAWQSRLYEIDKRGGRAVLWGSGSKAVAFLTTLGIHDEIEYAVDINPHRHGTFLAGSGQKIVAPKFLQEYKPEVVIVMNPIYRNEIQQELDKMGLQPELIMV
jgi:hypothetical protein